jgi:hypothetical protein
MMPIYVYGFFCRRQERTFMVASTFSHLIDLCALRRFFELRQHSQATPFDAVAIHRSIPSCDAAMESASSVGGNARTHATVALKQRKKASADDGSGAAGCQGTARQPG